MNPAMKIATSLAEAAEFFSKLPDECQNEIMAARVAESLDEWKREARVMVSSPYRVQRKKEHAV